MAYSTSYRDSNIFDLNILLDGLRFIISNTILAVIFLFLALEEIDWFIFSSKQKNLGLVIDETSWNIKEIF